jgi:hypothetical protein
VKPVCYDLFCGLGGWSEGFLAEGYECVGFDIEAHDYGTGSYPGTLILRDIRSIHGSELKDAAVIVASPPCQAYSYRAMPWKRAKALPPPDNTLFNECFRIQREAIAAAGHHIPLIVENVRGAQKWVGRAQWNYGSFYLWGDVPALMPMTLRAQKFNPDGTAHPPGSWFAIADSKNRGQKGIPHRTAGHWTNPAENLCSCLKEGECDCQNPNGNPRMISNECPVHNWDQYPNPNCPIHGERVNGRKVSMNFKPGRSFQSAAVEEMGVKNGKDSGENCSLMRRASSKSNSRKAASAMIAKIPFPLAQHIARTFKPEGF